MPKTCRPICIGDAKIGAGTQKLAPGRFFVTDITVWAYISPIPNIEPDMWVIIRGKRDDILHSNASSLGFPVRLDKECKVPDIEYSGYRLNDIATINQEIQKIIEQWANNLNNDGS